MEKVMENHGSLKAQKRTNPVEIMMLENIKKIVLGERRRGGPEFLCRESVTLYQTTFICILLPYSGLDNKLPYPIASSC